MKKTGVTVLSGTGSFLLLRRQDLAQLRLAETLYSCAVLEPDHSHARAYFEIVLKGIYTEQERGRSLEHGALSVAFQPVVESHTSYIHPEGLHSLKIEMNPAWLTSVGDGLDRSAARGLSTAANFAAGRLPWLGMRLYDEWQRMDAVSSLTIEGLVLEMLAEAIRGQSASPERASLRWLRQAEDLLRAEFATSLTLEYIARTVGVHPVYLARVFRQQHGCTVGDYVRRLRIEYACRHLAASDLPLGEVALAAGFADQSHFGKVFKRLVGLSPAAFRNGFAASSRNSKF